MFSVIHPLRRRQPLSPQPQEFHFCRIFPGDEPSISFSRHIHYLCSKLRLKPGLDVLHVGCGIGTVTLELVRFANVRVVAIDTSAQKLAHARNLAERAHVSDQVRFVHVQSLDDVRSVLDGQSFDVIVAIESLKNARSFSYMYSRLCPLLKIGGKIGIYEWCWALDFSTDDPDHCRLAGVLESTTGISHRDPPERCINTALRALAASGLRVLEWEDLGGKNDAIPWTTPLQRALASSDMEWPETDTSPVSPLFGGLSRSAAQVIIEASRRNLFSPMVLLVAQRVTQSK
ncbi:hypothetical protein NLI96_g4308 [Meripilus lineatus]|uniref:Methyltransferase domain-containing protein n=1 Tax=Meripilus lineatus TaxID=2056292 RepID=A0AAD5YK19_9APHY|nr:hypothetical protein NLI96_g4308 [Physisporinus lineatus]